MAREWGEKERERGRPFKRGQPELTKTWPKQLISSLENFLPSDKTKSLPKPKKMLEVILMKQIRGFHGIIINKSVTFSQVSGNEICIACGGFTNSPLNPMSTDLLKLNPGTA